MYENVTLKKPPEDLPLNYYRKEFHYGLERKLVQRVLEEFREEKTRFGMAKAGWVIKEEEYPGEKVVDNLNRRNIAFIKMERGFYR